MVNICCQGFYSNCLSQRAHRLNQVIKVHDWSTPERCLTVAGEHNQSLVFSCTFPHGWVLQWCYKIEHKSGEALSICWPFLTRTLAMPRRCHGWITEMFLRRERWRRNIADSEHVCKLLKIYGALVAKDSLKKISFSGSYLASSHLLLVSKWVLPPDMIKADAIGSAFPLMYVGW